LFYDLSLKLRQKLTYLPFTTFLPPDALGDVAQNLMSLIITIIVSLYDPRHVPALPLVTSRVTFNLDPHVRTTLAIATALEDVYVVPLRHTQGRQQRLNKLSGTARGHAMVWSVAASTESDFLSSCRTLTALIMTPPNEH
jgi:hypothetical protein